jgi:hypothetical protein
MAAQTINSYFEGKGTTLQRRNCWYTFPSWSKPSSWFKSSIRVCWIPQSALMPSLNCRQPMASISSMKMQFPNKTSATTFIRQDLSQIATTFINLKSTLQEVWAEGKVVLKDNTAWTKKGEFKKRYLVITCIPKHFPNDTCTRNHLLSTGHVSCSKTLFHEVTAYIYNFHTETNSRLPMNGTHIQDTTLLHEP